MSVPGGNLLAMASKVIAQQEVQFLRFKSNTSNAAGLKVPSYYPASPVKGSFQPLPKSRIQNLGLDWNSSYYTFYCSKKVLPVERMTSGDQIIFCGRKFDVTSDDNWLQIDGWTGVLCVDVGAAKDA